MRILLIANGLIDLTGHHYMEARAFKEEVSKRGMESVILAHRLIKPSIREELSAIPLFHYTPYVWPPLLPFIGPFITFKRYSQSIAKQLIQMSFEPSASDIVVSTLTTAKEMLGLALWLAQIPRKHRPFLAINFMINDISMSHRGTNKLTLNMQMKKLYQYAFTILKKQLPTKRLIVSTNNSTFTQTMGEVLNHPVRTFPLPVQHDFCHAGNRATTGEQPPLIVYLGHMIHCKGPALMSEVVHKVLERHPDCQFLFQANPVSWEKRWRKKISAANNNRVHIHRGQMTQDEYQNAMNRADLVLLPYLPSKYVLQTSGIFSEAMALGKPTIISDGTWMSAMAHRYEGSSVIIKRHEVEDIVDATLKALDMLPELTKTMLDISTVWRETMGMKAYVQHIIDAAGP